jgi:iron complex transport system permease protein
MDILSRYHQTIGLKWTAGAVLLLLLVLAALFSMTVGSLPLSVTDIVHCLSRQANAPYSHVIWNIRLPRMVTSVIAGAGLAVAGAIMQNILKNPLASPFTIGISQGAGFGAAFAIIILGAGTTHLAGNEAVTLNAPDLVVLSAFAGSMLAVAFILGLALLRRITPEAVILAGVALSAFFGAATMFLQYFASDMQMAATVFWTFGDLGKAGWRENGIMLAAFLIAFTYFFAVRWRFNALQWGDDVAQSLGVRVQRLRITGMILASLTVAVTTAFLGIIGFIGLLAPHIARFVVGNDYRFLIPCSALLGSLLLLLSDIVARMLMPPIILPVGIITSFLGAPLFLYLLIKGQER